MNIRSIAMSFGGGHRVATLRRWTLHTVFNFSTLHNFLPWLENKAASTISSSLSIANSSSYGNSLFASNSIQTGDCILHVPYSVQITPDNLPPQIRSLITEDVGNVAKLAIVLLIHKNLGQDSEWYPYISCLPPQAEMHNTIFWNESELEMIRQSSVYEETIYQKSQIEKDFMAIRPVFKSFCQSFGDFTCKDFMHACAQVGSRAWGSTKGLSLIPFADFLNHDGTSEAIVMSDDNKQCSEVIADCDYVPGEQVLIRYGKFSNATLMLDFGFTIPYNIYDQVQIQCDIPKLDPLRDIKLELLQQYFVPPTKVEKGLKYSVNSFTIKEVKSAGGKGKGVPQSLRALARVLTCTTPQELNYLVMEAAQTDGRLARRSLQDMNREIQAHKILSSLFIQLIEERNATITSLDSCDSSSLGERLPIRRQMAQDLLHGELRILKSASAWLENYCFSLT
ncbi:ribulose-1,5 bisphosphate carboxylase/oxygenase large subunit N-methyltransferase, chloroplastic isoform X1 [Trifolium pratense]|uniref:ribulose-1,5 bisphosphate carboxylase/oxygenase large subunit N-methyltransferase, chloroplastic isoform X1 n=1 Tax=Trifolium pratense TaxID=57577 RepID=UPI001E696706|nr:ribulose-1,5 bisphosphate carboxylase/oxygenase large subunit N-methyltransferase, chloroplastic isoform X1 [Trifolium pratense]